MCVRASCVKVVPGPEWDSRDGRQKADGWMSQRKSYTHREPAGELTAAPETLCSSFYHWGQMEIDSLRKFNFPIKILMKP